MELATQAEFKSEIFINIPIEFGVEGDHPI